MLCDFETRFKTLQHIIATYNLTRAESYMILGCELPTSCTQLYSRSSLHSLAVSCLCTFLQMKYYATLQKVFLILALPASLGIPLPTLNLPATHRLPAPFPLASNPPAPPNIMTILLWRCGVSVVSALAFQPEGQSFKVMAQPPCCFLRQET